MLRIYKLPNGRTYRYEEGTQPESAVLVGKEASEPETPEKRAASAAKRKRTAAKKPAKKAEED